MADVYRCLDEGGVGVFESPTGTGKSLSLICSTMRWLLDQEQKDADAVTSPAPSLSSGGDPSWVEEQTAASVQQQRSQAHTELIERRRLRAARVAAYDAADRATGGAGSVGEGARGWATHAGKRGLVAKAGTGARGGPEGEFLVEWSGASDDPAEALLDPSLLLDRPDDDEVEAPRRPQVFYTSRTHSQLAQVVGEVKKTGYKGKVAVVALGSRKNLCINEELRGLEGARLNEACLDLQDKASKERKAAATDGGSSDAEQSSKTDSNDSTTVTKSKRRNEGGRHQKKRGGCPHLAGGEARQARVLDRLLVSPLEIEELAGLGRRENACPYYAARAALPEAQLVALPYASLLSSSTRQALGLRLAGSVVVIDEAHNLIDTINEMHSVTLSARHLSETSAQLAQYEERYRARLKPANRQMVQQLLFVVRALRRALLPHVPAVAGSVAGIQAQVRPPGAGPASAAAGAPAAGATIPGTADERIVAVNSLLCSLNVDHINLLRLKAFCEASELAKKLQGFSEAQVQVGPVVASRPPPACTFKLRACRPHASRVPLGAACMRPRPAHIHRRPAGRRAGPLPLLAPRHAPRTTATGAPDSLTDLCLPMADALRIRCKQPATPASPDMPSAQTASRGVPCTRSLLCSRRSPTPTETRACSCTSTLPPSRSLRWRRRGAEAAPGSGCSTSTRPPILRPSCRRRARSCSAVAQCSPLTTSTNSSSALCHQGG